MDPVVSAVEGIKGLARSTASFFNGAIQRCSNPSDHNPIEILKRLQREAFSDLMRLRDRQDKIEQILSLFKSGKSPFQETSTRMKGVIDVVGALLFVDNDDQQACDTLKKAGIRTGINLRFIFETAVRQKDVLIAEFVASHSNLMNHDILSGSPLTLEKLMYLANINDWLSVVTNPLGARCNELGIGSNFALGRHIGRSSSFGPPLFNQYQNCGAGLIFKGSNIVGSLAGLVSGLRMQPDAAESRSLATLLQVTCQPFQEARFTFSGLWQMPRLSSQLFKLGTLVIPVGRSKQQTSSDAQVQTSPATARKTFDDASAGSVALMLELELDESTNISGWVEMQKLSPSLLEWGISLSDTPEDELGWGFRVGGKVERSFKQLQLEGFLNFDVGNKFNLQPGLLYAMDGITQTPALLLRTTWFM